MCWPSFSAAIAVSANASNSSLPKGESKTAAYRSGPGFAGRCLLVTDAPLKDQVACTLLICSETRRVYLALVSTALQKVNPICATVRGVT